MNVDAIDLDVPILIAGGGLVGLSTAMFLSQHGIASLVVERLPGTSPLPRAAHFHLRTLELFRLAGIEDEVKHRSHDEFLPEGAIVAMESLAGRKLADIIGSLNEGVEALSPCRRLFITQSGLEPILRQRALQGNAQILEGHEIVDIRQDSAGVSIVARNVESGVTRTLQGKYLVGADGAHSKVRELLGIQFDGRGAFSNSITIYFKADLAPYVGGKPLSVIYVNNAALRGVFRLDRDSRSGFLIVNTVGDPQTDPDAANLVTDISEARLVELVRIGAGVPDLSVRIMGAARWRATANVAERYQDGRMLLAGDAAHLMPPNGGFGGNTGVHDAHNLAWKLALVLKGVAGPALLETYEAERRPVAKLTVEQAYTRYVTRTATYLEARGFQPMVPDFNIELGYLYRSRAVISEDDDVAVHDDPRRTCGRPGSRAPHVWLRRNGLSVSSLDLFGRSFVLLTGSHGEAWCAAARKCTEVHLECYSIGTDLDDPQAHFTRGYGLSSTGAVLIRPDGFVGWRAKFMADDPRHAISHAIGEVLMR